MMNKRPRQFTRSQSPIVACMVLVWFLGAAITPAIAQDEATNTNDQAGQYQLEIDALNSMTHAMAPMVRDAKTRVSQMNEFISDQGLDGAYSSYAAAGDTGIFDGLTFNQAFHTALEHQKFRGAPTPSTSNLDQLQRTVTATQTLVQSEWDKANRLHGQVAKLTSFLTSQNKLDAYQEWAVSAASQKVEDRAEDESRTDTADAEHAAELRHRLDQQQYAQQSGGYDTDDGDDYYDGSYWNGYADPYYDVWGHSRVRERGEVRRVARRTARRTARRHNDWHRRAGARPHAAPSVRHPSRHTRHRR